MAELVDVARVAIYLMRQAFAVLSQALDLGPTFLKLGNQCVALACERIVLSMKLGHALGSR